MTTPAPLARTAAWKHHQFPLNQTELSLVPVTAARNLAGQVRVSPRQLELIEPSGLRLTFGSDPVTFTDVTPSDRRDELAAVLR